MISDSITRLFITRKSTLSQNSQKLLKSPPASVRAFKIDSIAFPPTFFTAASPNRIACPSGATYGVNCAPEICTSGGSTLIPISLHSPIYFTTLSGFDVSLVSSAAINSTG